MGERVRGVAFRCGFLAVVTGALASSFTGCEPPIAPPEPTPPLEEPVTDHEGPLLETQPITAPQTLETPVLIEATADDPSGVYAVILHFKPSNTDWQSQRMSRDPDTGAWRVELEAGHLSGASSVSYYLEAADGTPYHNTAYSPTTGDESPYRFNIVF